MLGFAKLARNIGNQTTGPATSKAAAISVGRNTPNRAVRHTGNGSAAGLNAQTTARIHTMSGYPTQANKVVKPQPTPLPILQSGELFKVNRGNLTVKDHRNPLLRNRR